MRLMRIAKRLEHAKDGSPGPKERVRAGNVTDRQPFMRGDELKK
jgi:hypothetical protein